MRWGQGERAGPPSPVTEGSGPPFSHPRNKECPTCRKKLVSKRSLRPDPNFDALISKIYPSREEYEAHQDRVLIRLSRLHNQQALSSSIEEGLRMQAMHRFGGHREVDAGRWEEPRVRHLGVSAARPQPRERPPPSDCMPGGRGCEQSFLVSN